MNKISVLIMSVLAVVVLGMGTAAAQDSNFPSNGQTMDIGAPTEPTKEICVPIGSGVWDCTQKICDKTGTNQSNQCKIYRYIVNDGKQE